MEMRLRPDAMPSAAARNPPDMQKHYPAHHGGHGAFYHANSHRLALANQPEARLLTSWGNGSHMVGYRKAARQTIFMEATASIGSGEEDAAPPLYFRQR